MRIKNRMKCTIYFPYAGVSINNGTDLKPEQLSTELESTRFFDRRLQRDAALGKVGIYLNDADKASLGESVIDGITTEANKLWPVDPVGPTVDKISDDKPDEVNTETVEVDAGESPDSDDGNNDIVETVTTKPAEPEKAPLMEPVVIGDISLGELNTNQDLNK